MVTKTKSLLCSMEAGISCFTIFGKDVSGWRKYIELRSEYQLFYYEQKLGHTTQGILQQNLSKYYLFKRAYTLCEYFNKFVNTLKRDREQKELEENYPWLDPSDERKYMTDQEILDKYIDLEKSCLTENEKKEVMEML